MSDGGTVIPQRKPSQCDLIAAVLRDHRYHTAAQIHQLCGFSRLNSRIAELRSRRGMNIVCEHVPGAGTGADAYRYRLLPAAASDGGDGAPPTTSVPSPPSGASLPSPADGITGEGPAHEAPDYQQLTLAEVAA